MIGKQAKDLDKFAYSPTRADIMYDNETHQFQFMPVGGTVAGATYPGVGGVKGVQGGGPEQRLISQMNIGLARMADIAKAEGSNVDSTIYQHLKALGYDFVDHPQTAGKGLMNALVGTMLAERQAHEKERKKIEELGNR
jgi:hypothetical protein